MAMNHQAFAMSLIIPLFAQSECSSGWISARSLDHIARKMDFCSIAGITQGKEAPARRSIGLRCQRIDIYHLFWREDLCPKKCGMQLKWFDPIW